MIAYLTGQVHHIDSGWIILTCNQIGYEVITTGRTLSLISLRDEIELYIYTHVREDQLSLYGFNLLEERTLFVLLISISGIGPKAALAILTVGTVDQIKTAISRADVAFFTKVKGLGKKRAQKIIIELKEKLGSLEELDLEGTTSEYPEVVVEALVGLGFVKRDIIKVLEQLDVSQSEADIIKQALGHLGKS